MYFVYCAQESEPFGTIHFSFPFTGFSVLLNIRSILVCAVVTICRACVPFDKVGRGIVPSSNKMRA